MYVYNATVIRWVDGDTVDVDIDLGFDVVLRNQRIRLWGIDAPESRTRNLEEKQRGMAATAYCVTMVPEGTSVKLISHKEGKYGRILGEVIYNEININELLIKEGHAVKY